MLTCNFIQSSLQSSEIGMGETEWVRTGFGGSREAGMELGWGRICSTRKKWKEVPGGCSQWVSQLGVGLPGRREHLHGKDAAEIGFCGPGSAYLKK